MEVMKFLFAFIEFMVVINSSYSYIPRRTYSINRFRPSSVIPRQCETPQLKYGSVRLRQRGKLIRYLCSATYTLIGDKYASCVQGQWDNPVPMCIKPGCPAVVPPDHGFTVIDKNGALTMLFCRSGFSVAGSQETYCNGTAWDRSLGTCRETHASPAMSCDFEVVGICDWKPDPNHDFEWTRKNGYTSVKQLQTGPAHDNTVGVPLEGHFMLAKFSSQSPNSVARLLSPLYPAEASKDACFRFYYHMYGATTGMLRIYIKPESLTIEDTLLEPAKYLFMEKKGATENAWLESVFEIDECDQDFQFIIEATEARTTHSNIAIDDVALLSGSDCTNEEFKSTTVTEEEGGIFDAQSCVNRCQETEPSSRSVTESTLTNLNKTVYILMCDCYEGCVDRKSCCLDYRSVCIFDFPTIDSSDVPPITTPTNPSTSTTTMLPLTNTSTSTVRSTKALTTTLPPTTIVVTLPTTKTAPTTITLPTTKTVPTTRTIPTTKTVPTPRTFPTTKTVPTTPTTTSTTPKPTSTTKKVSTIIIPFIATQTTVATTPTTVMTTSKTTTEKLTTRTTITQTTSTTSTTKKSKVVLTTKSTTPIVPVTLATSYTDKSKRINEWHSISEPTGVPLWVKVFGTTLLLVVIAVVIMIASIKFWQKYQTDRFNYKSKSKRCSADASDEPWF